MIIQTSQEKAVGGYRLVILYHQKEPSSIAATHIFVLVQIDATHRLEVQASFFHHLHKNKWKNQKREKIKLILV